MNYQKMARLLLFVFAINFHTFANSTYSQEQDVVVRLSLTKLIAKDSLLITCEIENMKDETILVLSSPFFITGVSNFSQKIHPWPGNLFIANMLFYEQAGNRFSFVGDADIRPKFNSFPALFEIPSKAEISLSLILPKRYNDYFQSDKYNLWLTLSFGLKRDFEKLIVQHSHLSQSFRDSIKKNDVHQVTLEDFTNLVQKSEVNRLITQIIQEGMKYKAHSTNISFTF